jgi:trigger factor
MGVRVPLPALFKSNIKFFSRISMAVHYTPTAPLEGTLTIQISGQDYLPALQKELNNYKNKAQLKGFRKGKTPIDLIKNLYGNPILQEIVEKAFDAELQKYVKERKWNLIGQPLFNADHETPYYDIHRPADYTFKVDLGYTEELDIKGLNETYTLYKVAHSDSEIQEELENLQDRMGTFEPSQSPVNEKDKLKLVTTPPIQEKGDPISDQDISTKDTLPTGEDDGSIVLEILLDEVDPEVRAKLLGQEKEFTTELSWAKLFPNRPEANLRAIYFKNLDENTALPEFSTFTIKEIYTKIPASLNDEFFDRTFRSEEVNSEETAKNAIRKVLESNDAKSADSLFYRDLQLGLLKANQVEFPENFLKRWLSLQDQNLRPETMDKEFNQFKESLVWTLIRDKIAHEYDIQVSAPEIRARFRDQILSYFGGMAMGDMSYFNTIIDKWMQDREQVRKQFDEILEDKVFVQLKSLVPIENKEISKAELNSLLDMAREDTAKRKKEAQALLHHDHSHDHDHHDHDHHQHDHDHHHEHSHEHDHPKS